jgi:hypothetical protein
MAHSCRRTVQFLSLVFLMTADRGVSKDLDRKVRVLKTGKDLQKKAVISNDSERTMQMRSNKNRPTNHKTGYNLSDKPPGNNQKGKKYSSEYDAYDKYGKQYWDNQHTEKLQTIVKTEQEKTMQEEAAFWERLLAHHHKAGHVEMSITAAPTKEPTQAAPSPAPITSTPAPSKSPFAPVLVE